MKGHDDEDDDECEEGNADSEYFDETRQGPGGAGRRFAVSVPGPKRGTIFCFVSLLSPHTVLLGWVVALLAPMLLVMTLAVLFFLLVVVAVHFVGDVVVAVICCSRWL